MRLIFTILMLISVAYGQTNYYVANSGSDANNGLTTATAWKTLSKVNGFSFSSGDSILLNRGDSWNERLVVPNSYINFGSYGTGYKPNITAFQTVTGLTDSSHVWSTNIPNSVAKLNTVLVDGFIRAKARFPNTGYLTYTSIASKTQLNTSLSGTPNYSGADVVVRTATWILDVVKVASQSGGILTLRDPLTYAISYAGTGFFFQNLNSALDTAYEWTIDSTNKVIRVYKNSVSAPLVQISTIDTLVWLSNKSNISFSNISITGANIAAFQIDTCNRVSITNCTINNSGIIAISALKTSNLYIANDSIMNSLSGAVFARQVDPYTPTVNTCDSVTVLNNFIKNTGVFAGMGRSGNSTYFTITSCGLNPVVMNNIIDSNGYVGIAVYGRKPIIRNNVVSNFNFIKNDGCGICMGIGAYFPYNYNDSGRIVSNIVYNGINANAGTNGSAGAQGIYLDDYTRLITVDSNTVFNATSGIFLHNNETGAGNIITNNTLFNNYSGGLEIEPDGNINQSITFKRNIIYSNISAPPFLSKQNYLNGTNLGVMDSNYYSHPYNDSIIVSIGGVTYSLAAWQTYSGLELNTKGVPAGIMNNVALFQYNPTSTPQTYSLGGSYYDYFGTIYSYYITLQPYTSAILFKAIYNGRVNLRMRKIIKK